MPNKFGAEVKALGVILAALEPLDDDQRAFVLRTAAERVSISLTTHRHRPDVTGPGGGASDAGVGGGTGSTPKQFLAAKKPINDVQTIACLAYYLTNERQQPHFKTKDLTALLTEAAGNRIGNPAQAVANATNVSGYLVAAGGGSKQISAAGEAIVGALPDQVAARVAAKDAAPRRRRAKKTGKP